MKHIEDDECPEITKRRLLQERAKKIMIKQALTGGEGSALPLIPRPGDADDVDGGVKVNMNPLEYDNRQAMANPPKPGDGGATLSQKHWPEPKTAGKARATDNPTPADLMAFSDLAVADKAEEGEWKDNGKRRLITIAESEKENDESDNSFAVGTPDAGKVLRFLQNNWDPTTFFDSYSGEYVCPCKERFKTMKTFEEHMLKKSQGVKGMEYVLVPQLLCNEC
jgi:hypothetical protein